MTNTNTNALLMEFSSQISSSLIQDINESNNIHITTAGIYHQENFELKDHIKKSARKWDNDYCDENEYHYILQSSSEIFEALSRQYRLEPMKSLSIQDYNYWIKCIYIDLKKNIFSKRKIDIALFGNIPHAGHSIIAALIASYNDIPYYSMLPIPFSIRFALIPPENKQRPLSWRFEDRINPLPLSTTSSIHEIDKKWIKIYKDQIDNGGKYYFMHKHPIYGLPNTRKLVSLKNFNLAGLKRIAWSIWINQKYKAYDQLLSKHENQFQISKLGKYIYFPLHLQPEMTTSGLGGRVKNDQFILIDNLLKLCRKHQISLVVKENPKQSFSHRSNEILTNLLSQENIHIAPRSFPSKDLLKGSLLVATVSGTVGIEAIRYNKPAYCDATSWWIEHPYAITTFSDLDNTISLLLKQGTINNSGNQVPDFDKFLNSVSTSCWPGCPWDILINRHYEESLELHTHIIKGSLLEIIKRFNKTNNDLK